MGTKDISERFICIGTNIITRNTLLTELHVIASKYRRLAKVYLSKPIYVHCNLLM